MRSEMTGSELRSTLKSIGWNQRLLSEKLGVGQDTVSKWVTGKCDVPIYASEYMRLVMIIKTAADEV